jgi:hypothetical protein
MMLPRLRLSRGVGEKIDIGTHMTSLLAVSRLVSHELIIKINEYLLRTHDRNTKRNIIQRLEPKQDREGYRIEYHYSEVQRKNLDFRRPVRLYQRFRSKTRIELHAEATSVVVHDSVAPSLHSTYPLYKPQIHLRKIIACQQCVRSSDYTRTGKTH